MVTEDCTEFTQLGLRKLSWEIGPPSGVRVYSPRFHHLFSVKLRFDSVVSVTNCDFQVHFTRPAVPPDTLPPRSSRASSASTSDHPPRRANSRTRADVHPSPEVNPVTPEKWNQDYNCSALRSPPPWRLCVQDKPVRSVRSDDGVINRAGLVGSQRRQQALDFARFGL